MSRSLTAGVDAVTVTNDHSGETVILGHRWVLFGHNGKRIAQQVRRSPTRRAAWRAFRRFCSVAQDITDEPWV